MDITADHITQYLDDRDDFDLELFAYRALKAHGYDPHLGHSYVDPVTLKARQYDVRCELRFNKALNVLLAIECKSLTPEFPLVVSRVARTADETRHDILKKWARPEIGDTAFEIVKSGLGHRYLLYTEGRMVGKSTSQIRWAENQKKFIASDAESYDKWSQALASATEWATSAAKQTAASPTPSFAFVMPVLLVNDATLWVVDYNSEGKRGVPESVDEAQLYVDRHHELECGHDRADFSLTHLHIYTRKGFMQMLSSFQEPEAGMTLNRIFAFAVRETFPAG